jgi:hypothetical protein
LANENDLPEPGAFGLLAMPLFLLSALRRHRAGWRRTSRPRAFSGLPSSRGGRGRLIDRRYA